jgi:hypothetical protein
MEEFEDFMNLDEEEKNEIEIKEELKEDDIEYIRRREDEIRIPEEVVPEITRIVGTLQSDSYKYIGEIIDDLRDGFGVCYHNDGTVETATWRKDLKEGFAKVKYQNGKIIQGEVKNGEFEGYCEITSTDGKTSYKGYYSNKQYIDHIIIHAEGATYTGEVATHRKVTTFGKLVKNKKVFIGEIAHYTEECGYGLHIYTSSPKYCYYGEYRNKLFKGYGEVYYLDGRVVAGFFDHNKKTGITVSMSKDGKITIANYDNDVKHGASITYSNGIKTNKLEINLYGFRVKSVDKSWKSYLSLNYPEFTYILKLDHEKLVKELSSVFAEELVYINKIYK